MLLSTVGISLGSGPLGQLIWTLSSVERRGQSQNTGECLRCRLCSICSRTLYELWWEVGLVFYEHKETVHAVLTFRLS